ncbi:DUF7343 domain-containing protein [Haloarchaeobius baliensis]|uniref:helix-turn-helix transcriptional regulator n=1 Tax=Haloarchaeobius baliensis TaxID=1670458 RepID=UPI003F8817F3
MPRSNVSVSLFLVCLLSLAIFGAAAPVGGTEFPQLGANGGSNPAADAAPSQDGPSILNVTTTGEAHPNVSSTRFVYWSGQQARLNVTVAPPNGTVFRVCVSSDGSDQELGCEQFDAQNESTVSNVFYLDGWQVDRAMRSNFTVELLEGTTVLDQRRIPFTVMQPASDADEDGLDNDEEVLRGTSPFEADTDGDGLQDGAEVDSHDTDPLLEDTDADGLPDAAEVDRNTDPREPDTDSDGLRDGPEVSNGTDPLKADTDGDGLNDGMEVAMGSNPLVANSDDDGIPDGREVELGLDPTNIDSDGDMLDDDTERMLGTNPKSALTPVYFGVGGLVLLGVVGLVLRRRGWKAGFLWTRGEQLFALPAWVRKNMSVRREPVPDAEATGETTEQSPAQPSAADDQPTTEDGDSPEERTTPDDRIWTDRDEVLSLIQENDGRVKQREIVEQVDWSESKVSRTLSQMEEDKQISRIEIGREKIVTLYDEEPDVFQTGPD